MADVQPAERVVLKILNGVQAGSEVSLANGEYLLGSGADDDIQLIDVSLKAGFARLKLATGMIYVRGGSGMLVTKNGLKSEAGSADWQEIEPLDIVTVGTTRLALGPASAQWATIADLDAPSAKPKKPGSKPVKTGAGKPPGSRRALVFAVIALTLASVAALRWFLPDSVGWIGPRSGGPADLDVVRAAIAPFDFAKGLAVRQEVDGVIYLTGYVEASVERRAVQGAIEKSGIPVRIRIGVLEVLRNELNNLVTAEKVNVKGTVRGDGVALLDGVILDEARANLFTSRISGDLVGIARVDSTIKTAPILFGEIEKLARASQIDSKVVFRLDKDVIEANGIIGTDKIDAWAGFLQSYSRRFGQSIGLRSFVQLQNAAGTLSPAPQLPGAVNPIFIGPQVGPAAKGDILVDLDKLRRGQFDINDVLARPEGGDPALSVKPLPGPPAASATAVLASAAAGPAVPPGIAALRGVQPASWSGNLGALPFAPPAPLTLNGPPAGSEVPIALPVQPAAAKPKTKFRTGLELPGGDDKPAVQPEAEPVAANQPPGYDARSLMETVTLLFQSWRAGTLRTSSKPGDQSIDQALNMLASVQMNLPSGSPLSDADRGRFTKTYLPLFNATPTPDAASLCKGAQRMTRANVPVALAWLDLLSTTDSLSLKTFSLEQQEFILEVALSPSLAGSCMRGTAGVAVINNSLYVAESRRNPDFINFVARELPKADLGVSGINLLGAKYVSTKNGDKMREGSAPDGESRVAVVGELGLAIRIRSGFAVNVYGPDINWRGFNN